MHKKHFLICYDITHPKRLQRLHRLVSNQCFQLQYSVYYATLYPKQMDELIQKIEKIINRHSIIWRLVLNYIMSAKDRSDFVLNLRILSLLND